MFRVDLHVHTRRYSPCAELLNPAMLGTKARQKGLSGVVITEHDQIWSNQEIQELQRQTLDIRFYRGVEVSSASGHFVVIGIENLIGITPRLSLNALIEKIKPYNAALILVHHHLVYSNIQAPIPIKDLPSEIDAIEVASSVTFGKKQDEAEKIALKKGWTAVAGSDAHNFDSLGTAFTNFYHLPQNEKQLAEAIKSGNCFPARQACSK